MLRRNLCCKTTGTMQKRTTERYKRSKCKLPLPPRRINYHLALLLRLAQTEYQRITTLHKQQETSIAPNRDTTNHQYC